MAMKVEKGSRKFIKPFVPSPPTLRHYKIGFTDELVPSVFVSLVLFFPENSNHNPKFVSQLEKSLEKTLIRFYPLAGRYVQEIHTVDCNDEGADFIHAKVNIKLQDFLGSEVNFNFVDEFLPSKSNGAVDQFTDPLLAIQVTTFDCGGVAIGVKVSHRIADAATLCTFLIEWAAMNREDNEIDSTWPGFKSSSLFPARGASPMPSETISDEMLSKYTRKKLSFNESAISSMKAKVIANGKGNSTHQFSNGQLVSALIWKALKVVDQAIDNHPRESIIFQAINLRGKMASLIPKRSCGNIFGVFATKSGIVETTEELACLLSNSVKKTINTYSKVYHHSEEGQTMVFNSFPQLSDFPESANVIFLSNWCKFPFYEADFGFGKPTSAVPGTMPVNNTVILMDDAGGNGVEAYVFLEVKKVPYFEEALDVNASGA